MILFNIVTQEMKKNLNSFHLWPNRPGLHQDKVTKE
jgi:hypothetical protein